MMIRRMMTMYPYFVAGVFLVIIMQTNVHAVRSKRIFEHDRGSFASPNYPRPYPEGIHYVWILPRHFKTIRIDFIKLDLYNCVEDSKRLCDEFDYVYISGNVKEFYCNWHRPLKPITILPWTRAYVIFYSDYSSSRCKGRGFKAVYRTLDSMDETTRWSTTKTTPFPTESPDRYSEGQNKGSSSLFLLFLLAVPLILIIACLYSCFRTSRPSRAAANQGALQTAVDNWSYQTAITPAGSHPAQNTHRVLDRPPLTRTGTATAPVWQNTHRVLDLPPLTRNGTATAPVGPHPAQNARQDNTLLTVDLPPLTRTGTASRSSEIPAHHPPPSYDNVWEDDSQRFESPPSYEDVMREDTRGLRITTSGEVFGQ